MPLKVTDSKARSGFNPFSGIKKNVFALGIVSFLTDVSSEMVFPLVPIFMTLFLGAGKAVIGLMEGIADSIASITDIFFGYWSDKSGNRKKFVTLGYGISSVLKIGIAFSAVWQQMFVFRGLERVGKSIRTPPRDAIIADSADHANLGKSFSLHRALDTLGAIVGPIIAYLILSALGSNEAGYRAVFLWALVPAFLAVLAIVLLVREPREKRAEVENKGTGSAKKYDARSGFWQALKTLGGKYRRFVLVSMLFSLSYFSFALLILRANEIGIGAADILLMYTLYNIVYAVFSIPIGSLSDKIGRKNVIVASFFLYSLVCIGFGFASSWWQVAVLFAVYGIFVAADESVSKAYISELTEGKSGSRGIALGAYSSAVSAAYLPASAVFGFIWAVFGAMAAFGAAAAVAAFSGVLMYAYAK